MAALAYLASGESRDTCQPQHIVFGMIRGNPSEDTYFKRWGDIEKVTPYSLYLGQHINSISERSKRQPLLIIDKREGVGLILNAKVRGVNSVATVSWAVVQTHEMAFTAQGRAYWFATFPVHCELRVFESS